MTATDLRAWGKEQVLQFVDDGLDDLKGGLDWHEMPIDERCELLRQRNRVARFLGLPDRAHV